MAKVRPIAKCTFKVKYRKDNLSSENTNVDICLA